mmetsp:Transcript_30521/g.76594  ORF Transcript_30521/g.76594 Transcript_30521/m.76594 type:complete len:594 (-) Transcript_30521:14-1795(-)
MEQTSVEMPSLPAPAEGPLPGTKEVAAAVALESGGDGAPISEEAEASKEELDEFLVSALNNPKDRLTLLRLENDLTNFMNDERLLRLDLAALTSYQRLIVHRVAQHFKLLHSVGLGSFADQTKKNMILQKTVESRIPAIKFIDMKKEEFVDVQPKPVKIMRRPAEKSHEVKGKDADGIRTTVAGGGDAPDQQSVPGTTFPKTLEEREEEYAKARARIFKTEQGGEGAGAAPNDQLAGLTLGSAAADKERQDRRSAAAEPTARRDKNRDKWKVASNCPPGRHHPPAQYQDRRLYGPGAPMQPGHYYMPPLKHNQSLPNIHGAMQTTFDTDVHGCTPYWHTGDRFDGAERKGDPKFHAQKQRVPALQSYPGPGMAPPGPHSGSYSSMNMNPYLTEYGFPSAWNGRYPHTCDSKMMLYVSHMGQPGLAHPSMQQAHAQPQQPVQQQQAQQHQPWPAPAMPGRYAKGKPGGPVSGTAVSAAGTGRGENPRSPVKPIAGHADMGGVQLPYSTLPEQHSQPVFVQKPKVREAHRVVKGGDATPPALYSPVRTNSTPVGHISPPPAPGTVPYNFHHHHLDYMWHLDMYQHPSGRGGYSMN